MRTNSNRKCELCNSVRRLPREDTCYVRCIAQPMKSSGKIFAATRERSYCVGFIARAYGNKEKSNPKHSRPTKQKSKKNIKRMKRKTAESKIQTTQSVGISKIGISSSFALYFVFFFSVSFYIGKCYSSPNTFNANYRL